MTEPRSLLQPLRELHAALRDRVVSACERQSTDQLSVVDREGVDDTIYTIDRVSEELLLELCRERLADVSPFVLVAEGLKGGRRVLPEGTLEEDAPLVLIVDPIDGTRGLMYQKRSGWILSGVARNRGAATTLADIEVAVQTEIPLIKQHLSDSAWAVNGEGVAAERWDRLRRRATPLELRPSRARDLRHGFGQISRFFPGGRDLLAALEEDLVARHLGPPNGRAICFEDQYICSGGQLYELATGHDRFVAELRPLLARPLEERGEPPVIPCHPYDLCTELIARELGVEICAPDGSPLTAPLDLTSPVSWVGYANSELRRALEPILQELLRERGML